MEKIDIPGKNRKYARCRIGLHKWKYLVELRVCLICGRTDDYDGMKDITKLSPPIYKLKKEAEIKETLVFIKFMNRNRIE